MREEKRLVFVLVSSILALTFVVTGQASGARGEICSLPPDVGPCDGVCPRYFFNTDTGQCEEFIFGCCEGNANNFPTLEACETACLSNVAGSIPTVSSWSLLALFLLIMIAGTVVFRPSRMTALMVRS